MSDRPQSNRPTPADPTNWHRHVCREVVHIAGLVKLYADRLELLSDAIPLPPPDKVAAIIETADERLYGYEPGVSLHVDLEVLAHDLKDVAEKLEETAETNLPDDEEGAGDDR